MNRKFLIACIVCSSAFLFASEKDIFLPDITTVVEGDTAGFSPEINFELSEKPALPEGTGNFEIKNPPEEVAAIEVEPVEKPESDFEKFVSMNGRIGVGAPLSFTGAMHLHTKNIPNPFSMNLSMDMTDQFSKPEENNHYTEETILASADKSFYKDGFFSDLNFNCISLNNGLQGKEDWISSFSQKHLFGDAFFSWELPKNFEITANAEASFYNRNAKVSDAIAVSPWVKNFSLLTLAPETRVMWTSLNLDAYIQAAYSFDGDLKASLSESEKPYTHRGEFTGGLSWQKNNLSIIGNVSAVVGNRIGKNKALVPFMISAVYDIPVKDSGKSITISAEGGMQSEKSSLPVLEEMHKFSALSFMAPEVSDWYGTVNFCIPVKSSVTLNFGAEYRKTAFGNGFVQAVYENSYLDSGAYRFGTFDRQCINSYAEADFIFKWFSLNASWNSYWDFVPETQDKQNVSVFLRTDRKYWGGTLLAGIGVLSKDPVPNLNAEVYGKITDSVRIAVNVEDIVKLVSGTYRYTAGRYASRSGRASLFVKFEI